MSGETKAVQWEWTGYQEQGGALHREKDPEVGGS